MATRAELQAQRAAAGATYAAAAEAYVAAWAELHAFDTIDAIRGGNSSGFGEQPKIAGHAEFLRDVPAVTRDPASRAVTRRSQLLATLASS